MAKNSSLVVFNWKENPRTEREAIRLFSAISKAVPKQKTWRYRGRRCPPVVYLKELSEKLAASHAHFSLGAQDISWENVGAYTGGIGPVMLKQFGVGHVIIGHSERRRVFGETDEMVNKKVRAAFAAGLRVILCVGEPAEVREKGIRSARQYVKNQLKKDLQNLDSGWSLPRAATRGRNDKKGNSYYRLRADLGDWYREERPARRCARHGDFHKKRNARCHGSLRRFRGWRECR